MSAALVTFSTNIAFCCCFKNLKAVSTPNEMKRSWLKVSDNENKTWFSGRDCPAVVALVGGQLEAGWIHKALPKRQKHMLLSRSLPQTFK